MWCLPLLISPCLCRKASASLTSLERTRAITSEALARARATDGEKEERAQQRMGGPPSLCRASARSACPCRACVCSVAPVSHAELARVIDRLREPGGAMAAIFENASRTHAVQTVGLGLLGDRGAAAQLPAEVTLALDALVAHVAIRSGCAGKQSALQLGCSQHARWMSRKLAIIAEAVRRALVKMRCSRGTPWSLNSSSYSQPWARPSACSSAAPASPRF